jgi:hypothetical protein
MQIDLEQWAPCSFARHPGVGRDPVKYACAAHKIDTECQARLLRLDPGLRRDDEQKRGKASAVGRVFEGEKKTNVDFSARCSINFA